MMNVESAQAVPVATELQNNGREKTTGLNWLFDATALMLAFFASYTGLDFIQAWLSTYDRVLCSVCIFVGLLVAFRRSTWEGKRTKPRVFLSWVLYGIAALQIGLGVALTNPNWTGVAFGTILAGWCVGRIRGEPISHSLSLGLALLVPFAVEAVAYFGGFDWLETTTVSITSFLADTVGLPNAPDGSTVLFFQGVADQFSCIGSWDSVIGFLGVSLACILAFRRSLIPASITFALSPVVWIALRSAGWVTLSYLANRNETWYAWSFWIELLLFLFGVAWLVSLDQFFGAVFKQIPFEAFHPESPLIEFAWNWLCGLPNLVLRVPEQHKIALWWKMEVKLAGKTPSLSTDFDWMRFEFLSILYDPINAIGGVLDAIHSWRESRRWTQFFWHLPSFALLVTLYIAIAFGLSKRTNNQLHYLSMESQKMSSTESLETACNLQLESEFCKAIGVKSESSEEPKTDISEGSKRQLEFLCKRILSAEPKNQDARYRLGMIYALNQNNEGAFREMNQLANGDFPQANSWLAKALLRLKATGKLIPMQTLNSHLEIARKWEKVDFRLPLFYSRLLEERGEGSKAVFVLKEAVASNPQYKLELARLYARLGNVDGKKRTANEAENFFITRTLDTEKESDRLAVSEARILAERPLDAAEILEEGLRNNLGGERTRRQLSEIQLRIYNDSIRKDEEGKSEVDMALLKKAADTDPTNPNISGAIAKLVQINVEATPELKQILKRQLDLGITNVQSLLVIADGLYAKRKLPGAQKYWELAIEKEPENIIALNNLASCLVSISPTNADRSLELVNKANALSPNNANILDTWGEVLMAINRPKEALNKFEQSIRIDKGRLNTRKKLEQAYEANGMTEMAKTQSTVIRDIEQSMSREEVEKKSRRSNNTP